MKKTTRWAWENTWLVWACFALLVFPWSFAFLTVPDLLQVCAEAPAGTMLRVWLFGLGDPNEDGKGRF